MTSYLERPGGRIAYDDTGGDGPLVVAAPGMGDTRDSFRFLTPKLERRLRALLPYQPPDDLDSYRAGLRDMLRRPGRLAALRAMTKADKSRANDRMGSVVHPALVVMGGADDGDPAEDGRLVAEAVGGSLVMVEDAGHHPHVEFPQETAAAILDFARQVARA